jgi:hypothetical protein
LRSANSCTASKCNIVKCIRVVHTYRIERMQEQRAASCPAARIAIATTRRDAVTTQFGYYLAVSSVFRHLIPKWRADRNYRDEL